MSRLFLIRHAEPAAAWGGDALDPGLSELGQARAEACALSLLELGPLQVQCSPMRRCRETAAPFVARAGVAANIAPPVSEVVAPAGAADRRAWLQQNFDWRPGAPTRPWPDREPALRTWRAELLDFVQSLQADAAVFSHFIAINVIVGAAMRRDETIVCRPGHASITELAVRDGDINLVQMGEEMRGDDVR
ncbi:MAG: histidine phosphatase family protein [Hyphomonadaceae bacterium]